MGKLLTFIVLSSVSFPTFAADQDLKLFQAISFAGASALVVGEKAVLTIENVNCYTHGGQDHCEFQAAVEADVDTTTTMLDELHVVSQPATDLLSALKDYKSEKLVKFDGQGGDVLTANKISCEQPTLLDITISESNQTTCIIK